MRLPSQSCGGSVEGTFGHPSRPARSGSGDVDGVTTLQIAKAQGCVCHQYESTREDPPGPLVRLDRTQFAQTRERTAKGAQARAWPPYPPSSQHRTLRAVFASPCRPATLASYFAAYFWAMFRLALLRKPTRRSSQLAGLSIQAGK